MRHTEEDKQLVKLAVTIPKWMKEFLKKKAAAEKRTMSDIVEECVGTLWFSLSSSIQKKFFNDNSFTVGGERIIDQTKGKRRTPKGIKKRQEKDDRRSKEDDIAWESIDKLIDITGTHGKQ